MGMRVHIHCRKFHVCLLTISYCVVVVVVVVVLQFLDFQTFM